MMLPQVYRAIRLLGTQTLRETAALFELLDQAGHLAVRSVDLAGILRTELEVRQGEACGQDADGVSILEDRPVGRGSPAIERIELNAAPEADAAGIPEHEDGEGPARECVDCKRQVSPHALRCVECRRQCYVEAGHASQLVPCEDCGAPCRGRRCRSCFLKQPRHRQARPAVPRGVQMARCHLPGCERPIEWIRRYPSDAPPKFHRECRIQARKGTLQPKIAMSSEAASAEEMPVGDDGGRFSIANESSEAATIALETSQSEPPNSDFERPLAAELTEQIRKACLEAEVASGTRIRDARCKKCGASFSYRWVAGRPRSRCDACGGSAQPSLSGKEMAARLEAARALDDALDAADCRDRRDHETCVAPANARDAGEHRDWLRSKIGLKPLGQEALLPVEPVEGVANCQTCGAEVALGPAGQETVCSCGSRWVVPIVGRGEAVIDGKVMRVTRLAPSGWAQDAGTVTPRFEE